MNILTAGNDKFTLPHLATNAPGRKIGISVQGVGANDFVWSVNQSGDNLPFVVMKLNGCTPSTGCEPLECLALQGAT